MYIYIDKHSRIFGNIQELIVNILIPQQNNEELISDIYLYILWKNPDSNRCI